MFYSLLLRTAAEIPQIPASVEMLDIEQCSSILSRLVLEGMDKKPLC